MEQLDKTTTLTPNRVEGKLASVAYVIIGKEMGETLHDGGLLHWREMGSFIGHPIKSALVFLLLLLTLCLTWTTKYPLDTLKR